MRRLAVLVVALLVVPLALVVASPASAQTDPSSAEAEFVADINALRASKGLGELRVHPELVRVARGWAAQMAKVDQISHNPNLANAVNADWQKLGENVGVGMSVSKLHQAFVDSPAHYRNLVDPAFTHIGVGVVIGRDGAIFTTHQFMQLRSGGGEAATATTVALRRPRTTTATTAAPPPTVPETVPATTTTAAPVPPPEAPARLVLVLEQLRALDARAG
ncbi:MAG TPA: CAP domain-containing protein [Acidimicrobiales bacterium]|nr:CAP domain-containing protein [Acidimicrobiales bacterium]